MRGTDRASQWLCARVIIVVGPPPHSRVAGPATPTAQRADIVRDFKQAWEAKDIDALIVLLDPDATAIGDGGGLVSAELRLIDVGRRMTLAAYR